MREKWSRDSKKQSETKMGSTQVVVCCSARFAQILGCSAQLAERAELATKLFPATESMRSKFRR